MRKALQPPCGLGHSRPCGVAEEVAGAGRDRDERSVDVDEQAGLTGAAHALRPVGELARRRLRAGIPPLQAFTGFRIHQPCPTPKWNVEFSAQMVAGQHLVASSLDELPTPGYTIYNIRSYWNVTQAVMLTAGVENLGDKFYRSHLDPRSGSPTDVLFQPGRNYYFGFQVTY